MPGRRGRERRISRIERRGVPSTDTSARSARGVGISYSPQGNARAVNHSERRRRRDRERVGIAPPRPIHPESPRLITGDQAG